MRRGSLHPLVLLGLAYPLLVYLGSERFGARVDGLGLLALALPVAVSLGLSMAFARSLLPGRISLVGRFARAQRRMEVLPPSAEAYCRKVTALWSAFFLGNALVAGALALFGPLGWWATYTGLLAYLLALFLMGLELLYRHRHVEPRVRRELAERGLDRGGPPEGGLAPMAVGEAHE